MEELPQKDDLYKIRHSLAHVMAQAVLQIRPKARLGFGPPIENGFYYDFHFDEPISSEDFKDIEKRMRKIISEKQSFAQEMRKATDAVSYLQSKGENYKAEYCEELISQGETEIGFYTNGSFEDMCRGPHVEHTGEIPADCFKLDSLAGAYWRGDERREQLTRIYALAFRTKNELKDYIARRELAKERDHRKLGKELEFFHIFDEVGPGLPLWLPNGTVMREELESLAKETEARYGYSRVATPHIAKEELYLTSGHLPYYAEDMFPPMQLENESAYYLKAMNCPHHHLIFRMRPRSYRELPLRLAEYGQCYRYESSGSLSGLLRVRSMCMNDAHIYCTLEQLKDELKSTFQMTIDYYKRFRFEGIQVRNSTHDPKNREKYIDNPEMWKFSEKVVQEVIDELGVEYVMGHGEAAFYGPKIDFQAKTILGREESISTTQLDFGQALRFGLSYIGEDGAEHMPFVVHRAPLGTHERFFAFLIEHLGGAFPTWMSPIQARLVPVADKFNSYVDDLKQKLQQAMIRVDVDNSDKSFNKKIREAVTHKIPNIVIIGGQEAENNTITLRRYCTKEQVTIDRDLFIDRMKRLKSERIMDNFADVEV